MSFSEEIEKSFENQHYIQFDNKVLDLLKSQLKRPHQLKKTRLTFICLQPSKQPHVQTKFNHMDI